MRSRSQKRFLIFLLILVPILFLIGWSQASLNLSFIRPREPAQTILLFVLSTFIFVTFVIFSLILSRSLLKLYLERRRQRLGSKFETKMVGAFLGLSLLPVIVLFLCAYGLMNRSLDKWFWIPFDVVRHNSKIIQEQLHRATEQETRHAARSFAEDQQVREAVEADRRAGLGRLLRRGLEEFGLERAAYVSADGVVRVEVQREGTRVGEISSLFSWEDGGSLGPSGIQFHAPPGGEGGSRIFLSSAQFHGAEGLPLGSLVVAKTLPGNVEKAGLEIQREVEHYGALSREQKYFRRLYLSVLSLLTLLILFAATWFALFLSRQITGPIQALAEATQEVSRGNLGYQVGARAGDELGVLIQSFNSMTRQLQEGRRVIEQSTGELRQANRELEEHARYREAILRNIPAGVISLGQNGQITEINSAIERMVGSTRAREAQDLESLLGKETASEILPLLRRASRQGVVMRQTELELAGGRIPLALTVSAIRSDLGELSYVLVIEDLSELVKVQKATAWREVAQRIAHEIRNPLTPIQLSAERIQRLLKRTHDSNLPARVAKSLADCGVLISQEVNTLKALVDEFSRFARLPTARPILSDFNAIVENALGVFKGRLETIEIHKDLSPELPQVPVDPDQIKRMLINLVDNAAEAVSNSLVKRIWIQTSLDATREAVELVVADSGPGVTPPVKEKLFLPYFSTRRQGTGLGLAIVSRIVSDHNGSIRVEDNRPTGAKFIVEIPLEYSLTGTPGDQSAKQKAIAV